MQIEAVNNNVIFQFIDETLSSKFVNTTKSGILIPLDNTQSQIPRWGRVTHVGPDVTDIEVDDFILIEKGKWTQGFYVNDVRYWKTDNREVLATSNETPDSVY